MAHGHGADAAHSSADAHGHTAEVSFEVIQEGSPQDKLLVLTAMLALVLLCMFGWAMLTATLG